MKGGDEQHMKGLKREPLHDYFTYLCNKMLGDIFTVAVFAVFHHNGEISSTEAKAAIISI